MKRIGITYSKSTKSKESIEDLIRLQGELEDTAEYSPLYYENLVFRFNAGEYSVDTIDSDLEEFHSVFIWEGVPKDPNSTVVILQDYLETNGQRVATNWLNKNRVFEDKLYQSYLFTKLQLSIPQATYINREAAKKDPSLVGFEYPYIMKSVWGQQGNDNHLITSESDLLEVLENDNGKIKYIFQEFIPNDCDYRILMVNGELGYIIRRSRADNTDHRNNVSQGGTYDKVDPSELPEQVLKDCEKLAKHLGILVVGIDVVISSDTQQAYFLEYNSLPRIRSELDQYPAIAMIDTYLKSD